ncbi:glycosyl hydrolase [Frondihabitans australicus]|uniref:glycosyl hydrolase n=1 Tax=Frondihabitans australicus TaxID=386892 RepID=UPI001473CE31|nr:glycosyl hydrolase [Frondihabitans australicus]
MNDDGIGSWRGRPLDIAGTWSDDDANSVNFWQLQKGGQYADWHKPLDIAVGAIDKGETWARAAAGDYDTRWSESLTKLKHLRSTTSATTYIRFAHEMNGDWYPWSVNTSNYRDFMTAWKRYRALQKEIFPAAKLVFSVNRQSVGTGMDWRSFFPGAKYVDVVGVDFYNKSPYVATSAQWTQSLDAVDQWGAPTGLQGYTDFAADEGLPLAVSEWSSDTQYGDSPAFVTGFLDFVKRHSGTGAGLVEYEILFDVDMNDNEFTLYGTDVRLPQSSAAYRSFFSSH